MAWRTSQVTLSTDLNDKLIPDHDTLIIECEALRSIKEH